MEEDEFLEDDNVPPPQAPPGPSSHVDISQIKYEVDFGGGIPPVQIPYGQRHLEVPQELLAERAAAVTQPGPSNQDESMSNYHPDVDPTVVSYNDSFSLGQLDPTLYNAQQSSNEEDDVLRYPASPDGIDVDPSSPCVSPPPAASPPAYYQGVANYLEPEFGDFLSNDTLKQSFDAKSVHITEESESSPTPANSSQEAWRAPSPQEEQIEEELVAANNATPKGESSPPAPQETPSAHSSQGPMEEGLLLENTTKTPPKKPSGRQRNARARKMVSKPPIVKFKPDEGEKKEEDEIYTEPHGCGFAKLVRGYKVLPFEAACPKVEESFLVQMVVNSIKNNEEVTSKEEAKGKKVKRVAAEPPPTASIPKTSRTSRVERRTSESSSIRSQSAASEASTSGMSRKREKQVTPQIEKKAKKKVKEPKTDKEQKKAQEDKADKEQSNIQIEVDKEIEGESQVQGDQKAEFTPKKVEKILKRKEKVKVPTLGKEETKDNKKINESKIEVDKETEGENQVQDDEKEEFVSKKVEKTLKRKEETATEEKEPAKRSRTESFSHPSPKASIPSTSTESTTPKQSSQFTAPKQNTESATSRKNTEPPNEEDGDGRVDITGFTEEQIKSHFNLMTIVIEIPAISEEDVAKFASTPSNDSDRSSRSPQPRKGRNLRIASDSESPSPSRNKSSSDERRPFSEGTKSSGGAVDGEKKPIGQKDDEVEAPPCASPHGFHGDRSRSGSPPESPPPPASPDPDDDELIRQDQLDSGEPPGAYKNYDYRKRDPIMRRCCQCGRDLHTCIDDWYLKLGANSQYCSSICVDAVVERVLTIVEFDTSKRITMIGPQDQVKCGAEGALASQLGQFIRQSSSWVPVCITDRANELEKMEAEATAIVVAKAPKPMSKDSDAIRMGVRKAIADALISRTKRTSGCIYRMKDCKEKSETLEFELFKHCKQNPASPQYKSWFRKFITQVKDLKNKGLFLKILSGEITVQKIVTVEPEELGSKEVCGDSVDSAEATPPSIPPASAETTAATKELSKHVPITAPVPTMGRIPKRPKPAPETSSTLDALLGDGNTDTTSQHQSHLYDANCTICTSKAKSVAEQEKKELEEKERFREEERLRKEKKESFSLERIRHYDLGSERKEREKDRRRDRKKGKDRRFVRGRSRSHSQEPDYVDDQPEFDPKDPLGLSRQESPKTTYAGSDDGDFGGGGGSPFNNDSWRPVDYRKDNGSHKIGPSESWREPDSPRHRWDRSHIVWRGQMVMGNLAFVSSLIAISNPAAFEIIASAELPASLRIKGRIKPIIVFEYLGTLRGKEKHNVICMKLDIPLDDEGEKRYMSIYTDMLCKDRYQVLDLNGNGIIKDAYLMPVEEDAEPPAVLLPFDGPGVGERHPAMIMCVMVRYNHITDSWRPIESSDQRQQHEEQQQPMGGDQMPENATVPPFNGVMSRTALSALTEKVSAILESRKEPAVVEVEREKSPDTLLPKKFFDLLKKDEEQPEQPFVEPIIDANDVHTLADLLLFIQVTENPKKMKAAVARFMMNPELTEQDRVVIRKRVMEKIAVMKQKKRTEEGSTPVEYVPNVANQEQEEYHPDEPNEPEDEPAQDNDSTAGTINEDTAECISPSDFDTDKPTSFLDTVNEMDMVGMLSSLPAAPTPPIPPTFGPKPTLDDEKGQSRPSSVNSELVVAEEANLSAPPPPPIPSIVDPASGIPLPPTAPEFELSSIPTPSSPSQSTANVPTTGGIPVLCRTSSQILDVSEANSVEAMMGGDSPPDEDSQEASDVINGDQQEPQQQVQQPMFYPVAQPPPNFYPRIPMTGPPPMGGPPPPMLYGQPPPCISMMSMPPPNMPPGLPPPPASMMSGPPPIMVAPPGAMSVPPPVGMPLTMAPSMGPIPHPMLAPPPMLSAPPPMHPLAPVIQPPPVEFHGSAGFKGLAPSLGGQRPVRDSIIDYFQGGASTKTEGENKLTDPTATTLVLPAGTSTRHIGYMPGYGKSAAKHDNIPRTPTPSPPPPTSKIRPGASVLRPGATVARPGAAMPKRIAPGARIPQKIPSPDAEEMEIMKREERRRLKQIERKQTAEKRRIEEEELERKRQQKRRESMGSGGNAEALAKIPRNAPPSVVLLRVRWVADTEGCSIEEAEERVREHHMMKSDDESSSDDAGADASVETRKKKRGGKREKRRRGFKEQHVTGYVHIHRQKRALNVEYEDDEEIESPQKEDSIREEAPSSRGSEPTSSPLVCKTPHVAPPPPAKPHNPLMAPPPPPPPPPKPASRSSAVSDVSMEFSPPPMPRFPEMRSAGGTTAPSPRNQSDYRIRQEVDQPSTSEHVDRSSAEHYQGDYGNHEWEDDRSNNPSNQYERGRPGPPMRGGFHQQGGGGRGGFSGRRFEEDFRHNHYDEEERRFDPKYRPHHREQDAYHQYDRRIPHGPGAPGGPGGNGWDQDFHHGPPNHQPPRPQSPYEENYSTYESPRAFDHAGPPRFQPHGDRTPLRGGRGGGPPPPFHGGTPQRGAFRGRGAGLLPPPKSSGFFNSPAHQRGAPPSRGSPMNRGGAPRGRGALSDHWNSGPPMGGAPPPTQGSSWGNPPSSRGRYPNPSFMNPPPQGPPKPPPLMPGVQTGRGPPPSSGTTNSLMMAPPPPPPPPPRRY